MPKSRYQQEQYPSRDFLESAGAILFDFRHTGVSVEDLVPTAHQSKKQEKRLQFGAAPRVAIFYSNSRKEALLPKGRRNINEPREVAALRETYEETGLRCRLLPVTLDTRATSVDPSQDNMNDEGYTLNEVRQFDNTTDPFWMTVRHSSDADGRKHVKLIWWYIAVVDDVQDKTPIELDPGCELRLEPISSAAGALTWEGDTDIVREAINVVQTTLGVSWSH